MSSETKSSNFSTHLVFLILLGFELALKYYLYFASPLTGTGLTPGRLGATLSHLLIWAAAYSICFKSRGNAVLLVIGVFVLLAGFLIFPLLGWIGVVVMYVIYRSQRKEKESAEPFEKRPTVKLGPDGFWR